MTVPPALHDRWPMFVLIEREKITWTEVETVMSIDDVADLDEACAFINEARNHTPEMTDEELRKQL